MHEKKFPSHALWCASMLGLANLPVLSHMQPSCGHHAAYRSASPSLPFQADGDVSPLQHPALVDAHQAARHALCRSHDKYTHAATSALLCFLLVPGVYLIWNTVHTAAVGPSSSIPRRHCHHFTLYLPCTGGLIYQDVIYQGPLSPALK